MSKILSDRAFEQLREIVRDYKPTRNGVQFTPRPASVVNYSFTAYATVTSDTTGIPAATKATTAIDAVLTPGEGTVNFYSEVVPASLSDALTLELSTGSHVAYNMSLVAVAKNRPLQMKKIGRHWFVDFESCPAAST